MNILHCFNFFITKRRFLIFSDKLSKVIEVKKGLTKFRFAKLFFIVIARLRKKSWQSTQNRLLRLTPRNDGLSEYCENIFAKQINTLKKDLTKLILNFCNSKARQILINKNLSLKELKKFKLLCSRFAVRGSRFAVRGSRSSRKYYLIDLIT